MLFEWKSFNIFINSPFKSHENAKLYLLDRIQQLSRAENLLVLAQQMVYFNEG
jgi:hypothetical protein